MAAKRRFIASSFSLYGDLDIGSSSNNELADKKDKGSAEVPADKKRKSEEAEDLPCKKVYGAVKDRTLVSVCGWRKGEREEMQDAHFLDDSFGITVSDIERCALYAIFDGHAGRKAADFAKTHLPSKLKEKFSACPSVSDMEQVLKKTFIESFKQVDEMFLSEARKMKPTWKDGTTATTILLVNDIMYCANIGDSRAVVCRSKGSDAVVALQLTVDHSPLHFEERMRIQKAGGNVKFVLIACDGLWKTFNNQEAIEFVMSKFRENNKSEVAVDDRSKSLRHLECERVVDALAAESVKRGCGDNVSVIIIAFGSFLDEIGHK